MNSNTTKLIQDACRVDGARYVKISAIYEDKPLRCWSNQDHFKVIDFEDSREQVNVVIEKINEFLKAGKIAALLTYNINHNVVVIEHTDNSVKQWAVNVIKLNRIKK